MLAACDGTITAPEIDGDAGGATAGEDAGGEGAAPMVEHSFDPSDAAIVNPERGFYVGVDLMSPGSADRVRSAGHSMAIALVRLDDYRDRPLDDALLADLETGFASVRAAGIKVILRFMYNASFSDDAPLDRILEHIGQLAPVLERNAGVVAVQQAGFIGAWGEWHGSTNGLDDDASRTAILTALLDALPASRSVQVRTPMFKDAAFPGGPVTDAEAYDGTARARVGHHNDCFLASDTDLGTYDDPVEAWRDYVSEDSQFTPMGGETCRVNEPATACDAAIDELASYHWSYLNLEYNQDVIAGWESDGCFDEIHKSLGYRFALQRVAHSESVAPGGVLSVEIDLVNLGFAAPFNRRPVYLVLTSGARRLVVRLDGEDPRRWAPGESVRLAQRLRIPADASPGDYTLSLWLPDGADSLAADPRYAIQLANDDVWTEATGDNVLSRAIDIDPDAPGPVDPTASEFEVID